MNLTVNERKPDSLTAGFDPGAPDGQTATEAMIGAFGNATLARVRLLMQIPAGSRIRGKGRVDEARPDPGGRQIVMSGVEVDGGDLPALMARCLSVHLPPASF